MQRATNGIVPTNYSSPYLPVTSVIVKVFTGYGSVGGPIVLFCHHLKFGAPPTRFRVGDTAVLSNVVAVTLTCPAKLKRTESFTTIATVAKT